MQHLPNSQHSINSKYTSIKGSNNAEEYLAYLEQYPNGRFAGISRARVKTLAAAAPAPRTDAPPATQPLRSEGGAPTSSAPGSKFRDCADCPEMVVIPAGNFQMGSNDDDSEKPVHAVTIGKAFALGKTEITVGQYLACVNAGSCAEPVWREKGSRYHYQTGSVDTYRKFATVLMEESSPITGVSWNNAQQYGLWLSQETGKQYRLPSEAEWEYACRAGGNHTACGGNDIDAVAWHNKNSGNTFHPVARKQANAYGLYDMSGNMLEWVEDCHHENYSGAPSDGSAWMSEDCGKHVHRGGSWAGSSWFVRSSDRSQLPYKRGSSGFRVARTLP
ncbi:MAG: formylglycine-generating enzyme family protein [Sulfuricellaceae bacterium]